MIQNIKISQVKNNPNNPRLIKDDKFRKLVESLKSFPEMATVRPIVCNTDMIILGGNMRFKAMKEAGWKEVPVEVVDWPEDKQREFIIKDNVSGGEWDWSMIANEWEAEQLDEWGLDVPDFAGVELEAEEDDYEMPNEVQTDIVIGDLFEIGEHRLLCGDSTDSDQVARLMDGEKADIIVIDPPYEMVELYYNSISIHVQNESNRLLVMWDFKRFADAAVSAVNCGWTPQYEFIWDCVQSWYTPNRPLQRHKALGVFSADSFFNTQTSIISDGKNRGKKRIVKNTRGSSDYTPMDGAKHISTVEQFPNTQQKDEHGHGKPIQWIGAILGGINGCVIFDAFCGSGAFMVTAHQLNRKCYAMELDPQYCQVIIDRMMKLDPTLTIKRNGQEWTPIKEQ